MTRYLFVLGRSTELCHAELKAVVGSDTAHIQFLSDEIALVEFLQQLDTQDLQKRLGGVIKIGEIVDQIGELSVPSVMEILIRNGDTSKRLEYGLSFYTPSPFNHSELAQEIKTELSKKSILSRFVLPKEGNTLSSVVVKKKQIVELLLFQKKDEGWLIAKTTSVQDADAWSEGDFGRPFASPKMGMLPPKVARMMVNLAISNSKAAPTLLDPFCGMGTILGEALLLGVNVVGSDQSKEVADKAQKNLEWSTSMYRYIEESNFRIIVSDATHISDKLSHESIDMIVTEPFMGAVFEKIGSQLTKRGKKVGHTEIKNTLKGLTKLYIGALKDWKKLLRYEGVVVMAFPEIHYNGHLYGVKKMIDTCENLGYTLLEGPYTYARPQAIVKRQIYVLRRN